MILYAHVGDNELIQRINRGQTDLSEVLMRRHTPALLRTGRMFGIVGAGLEAVVAKTHRVALQNLHRFDSARSYRSWITAFMIKHCAEAIEDSGSAEPETTQIISAPVSPLDQQLDNLPNGLRSVLMLREVEGFSESETATLLQLPEPCVKAKHAHAVEHLGKSLRKRIRYADAYPTAPDSTDRIVRGVLATPLAA